MRNIDQELTTELVLIDRLFFETSQKTYNFIDKKEV
jgi:hypothetical protein